MRKAAFPSPICLNNADRGNFLFVFLTLFLIYGLQITSIESHIFIENFPESDDTASMWNCASDWVLCLLPGE